MAEMVDVYKNVVFSGENTGEADSIHVRLITYCIDLVDTKLWFYDYPGHELVMLLKLLAARDKAQVFVLPPLKDHFIFDPPDPVNYFK